MGQISPIINQAYVVPNRWIKLDWAIPNWAESRGEAPKSNSSEGVLSLNLFILKHMVADKRVFARV